MKLDRGAVFLASPDTLSEIFPDLPIPALPFIAGYAVAVGALNAADEAARAAKLQTHRLQDILMVKFPAELGLGTWVFVERAAALPWRRVPAA